jgi:uncharacterized protein (TIRG00374 family)
LSRRGRALRLLVRLIGPALLALVIWRTRDRGAIVHAVAGASLAPLAIAALLNVLNIHLKVVRWQVILRVRGIHYGTRRAWGSFLTSLYLGMLTPGRVGDVLRARYLKHDLDVPYAEGVASVVVDRLCDLYVLVVFVAVGCVRFAPVLAGGLAWITWAGVAATALGPLVLVIPGVAEAVLGRAFARLSPERGEAGLARFLAAVRANVGRSLWITIPLTVLTFAVNYLQGFLIARAIGLPMTFFDATCLLAIASLLGLLPISVSGVGVRELFFSLAFPMLGFSAGAGVTFGLLVFFVIYLVIVAVGFVSWQLAPPPSAPPLGLDEDGKLADDAPPVLSRVRTRLSDLATSLDAAATRVVHSAANLFLWPLLYAVAFGSGVFVIRHMPMLVPIDTNKAGVHESIAMVVWTGVALAGLGLFYGLAVPVARIAARRRGAVPPGAGTVIAACHRRLRPILALPLCMTLALPAIERDSPKETFFLIALAALVAATSVYAWLRPPAPLGPMASLGTDAPPPRRRAREAAGAVLATAAVAALWAGYGYFFSRLALTNHRATNTRTIDLGYYDNIFWQSIHGHPLACSFIKAGYHGSAHFDPILVLLSPLYLVYPRAEFLLVFQSVWLGAGVVPVYLIARARLGSRLSGVALATMYALYPALHGANMYEFHSLTLISPVVLWLLHFLESGRLRAYWLLLPVALLVREDVSILMCFVGLYAILARRPRWTRLGWVTILVSVAYFGVVKRFFMTSVDILNSGKESYSFAYYYEDLIPNHNGVPGLLISLATNPVFILKTMLAELKILYVLTLFVPLCFLPLFARPGRVMLAWGIIFCLLASRGAVFSPHFQYSSTLIPIAFAMTPAALRQIEDGALVRWVGLDGGRVRRALLSAAFVASLLVSWKFGGILENTTFRGGFVPVTRSLTDKERETYTWIREQVDKIPPGASVALTNRTGAHAANRREAFFYPEHSDVGWVFIDESELKGADLEKHNKNVGTGVIELVTRRDKLALYRAKKK